MLIFQTINISFEIGPAITVFGSHSPYHLSKNLMVFLISLIPDEITKPNINTLKLILADSEQFDAVTNFDQKCHFHLITKIFTSLVNSFHDSS